jgi:Phosphotransferase enzyme family
MAPVSLGRVQATGWRAPVHHVIMAPGSLAHLMRAPDGTSSKPAFGCAEKVVAKRSQDGRTASEHPVVRAWAALGGRVGQGKVEELKVTKKSSVYRLNSSGPGGSAVVAKRWTTPGAAAEAEIYERVLPRLPLPRLHYYGRHHDEDGYSWLFLEDAGDRAYFPRYSEHRTMAAHWLGALHASGAGDELEPLLRSRRAQYYATLLRDGRERVTAGLGNPALDSEDRAVLRALLQQCELVESRWQELVSWCEQFASTVVHGDFVGKNVRLVERKGADVMIALDWELAGWGPPATDLAQFALHDEGADLQTYRDTVSDRWTDICLEDVQRSATVGLIFRLVASVSWASEWLAYEWVRRPMMHLHLHRGSLAKAMTQMGWG